MPEPIYIPESLVLGCNTPHGIGVLSDWIEEQTGCPFNVHKDSGFSNHYLTCKENIYDEYYLSGYGVNGYGNCWGNGTGYGPDWGNGVGYGDLYGDGSGDLYGDG